MEIAYDMIAKHEHMFGEIFRIWDIDKMKVRTAWSTHW